MRALVPASLPGGHPRTPLGVPICSDPGFPLPAQHEAWGAHLSFRTAQKSRKPFQQQLSGGRHSRRVTQAARWAASWGHTRGAAPGPCKAQAVPAIPDPVGLGVPICSDLGFPLQGLEEEPLPRCRVQEAGLAPGRLGSSPGAPRASGGSAVSSPAGPGALRPLPS